MDVMATIFALIGLNESYLTSDIIIMKSLFDDFRWWIQNRKHFCWWFRRNKKNTDYLGSFMQITFVFSSIRAKISFVVNEIFVWLKRKVFNNLPFAYCSRYVRTYWHCVMRPELLTCSWSKSDSSRKRLLPIYVSHWMVCFLVVWPLCENRKSSNILNDCHSAVVVTLFAIFSVIYINLMMKHFILRGFHQQINTKTKMCNVLEETKKTECGKDKTQRI